MPVYSISNTVTPFDECKNKILSYLEKMEKMNKPESGKVYYVRYRMHTEFSKELQISSSETVTEVMTSKNMLMMKDQNMKVFGDEENVFVVIPKIKKIYWNKSDPRIFNDANTYKKFLDIQRSLLNSAVEISCVKQNDITIITVKPSAEFSKRTKLLQQKITYNNKSERIISVDNSYNRYNKIKNQTIVYEALDFNSSKKIASPITALFRAKELKPAYKGFEIIDNRENR